MTWLRGVRVPPGLPPVEPSGLPGLLRWSGDASSDALIRAVTVQFLSRTTRALGAAFAAVAGSDHPRAPELREAVRDLPDAVFFRLAIAPEIFAVLAGTSGRGPDDLVGFLIGAVRAERGEAGWTAVGDREVGGRAAPRLSGGPVVDAVSPSALRVEEPRCGPPLPWSDDALSSVRDALDSAFGGLRETAPAAWRLVRDFTRVVVVRREGEHPDVFRSSSTNGAIGRTLLVNPGLASVGRYDLVEALVHEAIHHLLYMAELSTPMVLDPAACADVRPVSPWTGNPLTVHSYLHACLVWYGLLHLWTLPSTPPSPELAPRVATLRAGFERPLLGPLAPVADRLAPWVPEVLAELER